MTQAQMVEHKQYVAGMRAYINATVEPWAAQKEGGAFAKGYFAGLKAEADCGTQEYLDKQHSLHDPENMDKDAHLPNWF